MARDSLVEKLKQVARDGKISCTAARRLAGEYGLPVREVGKLCDELEIKIHSCELGCF